MLSRIRPLAWVCLAVLVVSLVIAVVYFVDGRPKHGVAFIGLAVVAGIGVWFTTAPSKASVER
jgi:hypothetical protein